MEAQSLFELIMRQKIFAGAFILFFFLLVVELIRRRALKERYAILWLLASMILLPLVLSHKLIAKISGLLGIAYAPLTVLLTGILFLILINLHFSVALSRHRDNESSLALKLAEQQETIDKLKKKLEEIQGEQDSDDG